MKSLITLAACTGLAIALPITAKGSSASDAAALIDRYSLREGTAPSADHPAWERPRRIGVWTTDLSRVEWLAEAAPGVELVAVNDAAGIRDRLADADALIGSCSGSFVDLSDRARWIQVFTAGVENCVNQPQIAERDIVLTNMQRVRGPAIAEHVIAMMMSLARQLPHYGSLQADSLWRAGEIPAERHWEVDGKTLLVVGLGGIGEEVARKASALGMRVLATRNSSRSGPAFVERVELASELPNLIGQADVIVNSTPLTPTTRNLFDKDLFARAKKGALFVNVGRGGSVVTNDLIEALETGRLGGAGLDVTEPEPLPSTSPLWQLPNVIITPHISARSDSSTERSWIIIKENLRRYVAGERLLNVVDVARGY